jgi:hypothetical protein
LIEWFGRILLVERNDSDVEILFEDDGVRMKVSDRRMAQRFSLTIPLLISEWKSLAPAQNSMSINVSEHGVYFETDKPLCEGAVVQIRLEMPEEVTGNPAAEWFCTGKVTRVHPPIFPSMMVGVSVRFDCYDVMRSAEALLALELSQQN